MVFPNVITTTWSGIYERFTKKKPCTQTIVCLTETLIIKFIVEQWHSINQ